MRLSRSAVLTPLLLLLVAVAFSVTGELLLKYGVDRVGVLNLELAKLLPTLVRVFSTPAILAGFTLIFTGSIFWLSVISRVPLSYAYPLLSTSYVFVVLGSWFFLGETLTLHRIVGVLIICTGVVVVFRS
ncbi:MAG: EamA family transporter [Chloroflexi bacterium]|nr:EamA family transporter [Chloroflexota bacterium]